MDKIVVKDRSEHIAPNFQVFEIYYSPAAARLKINNMPDRDSYNNAVNLIKKILQPLRDYYQKKVVISSFYRCPALNEAVEGAKCSYHLYGLAADITIPGVPIVDVMRAIKKLKLPYDRIINEYGQWVHVQMPKYGCGPLGKMFKMYKNKKGKVITDEIYADPC